uniref:Resistance protein candidate RGC2S n=1 Tax=Lactuca sativa TaxID=4236 RepID=Q9ZSC9_LACSA|nr:resistance protein candidate RGC2S [Lactuca sativa]
MSDPTGIAGAIINPIAQRALVPVTDHVGYMISCRKYVRVMQTKMTELNTSRISVEEHISRNTRNHLQIPSQIKDWLDQVEGIRANVENFPIDVITCCSLRIRHKLGQKAFKITEQIESLTRQLSLISWTDDPVPLGRVGSMNASTSASSSDDFPSREKTFTQALKALEPNQQFHMVALCGMGGVGKTRMMQRLKKAAEEKKLFNYIVRAVIGEKTDPFAIQEAIADYLGIQLNEKTKPARADKLREWFKKNSDGGKTKFLIVLDDVWQLVDLEDIGLSPFPNQGVDFKVLLTSRDSQVCTMMGVEANSIINVGLLTEAEAQSLFQQFVETSEPELQKIGEDIVRKCCGLPIAIKTMACTLRNKRKDAWKDALSRIEHYDIHNVAPKVFETSYHNLQEEETKSTFLMCGLFPEDFDIPTEELMRYGWGLKLFDRVYTIREARTRLNTCIERLVQTNLLIESDDVGCVKMHDLVRAFVLGMFSEVEHASIVNHGNMPEWTENDITDSCKRISLTCKSMSKFPGDFKFPNLMILKLMHGDKSLRFPQDFYEGMEKLHVISYDKMKYPLLPLAPRCSTNIRVLHLTKCSLKMFDCSCIGNLSNLEVLSFANSRIEWLPSTVRNLKKLRLLDLRFCDGLRIEQGVLKSLVKLEEFYIGNASGFIDDNCNEMAERSDNLSALEFAFFNNKAEVKNMSFENLERFKISVGRSFDGNINMSSHSYENMLQLVTNKGDVLDSKLNGLFLKTKVLFLSVHGMNDLEDVEVKSTHPTQSSSFCNLKVLIISKCVELRYLFKLNLANTLSRLEHLEVCECENMEELIHTGICGEETITFPKLKFLSLSQLPKLSSLCHNVNIIGLPHLVDLILKGIPGFTVIYPQNKLRTSSLLKEEVVIPKLETLQIDDMENLEEIWPCELSGGEKVKLREIKVSSCDKLVNLFPRNPMSLLHHLEELKVKNCGSIESLFNIDLDCVGAIGEEDNKSLLRSINMENLGKLREVWRIKGADNSHLINGFQAVESIKIEKCKRFSNIFTPITANFYLVALLEIQIEGCGGNHESEEQIEILSEKETLQEVTDTNISNDVVLFPSCLMHSFHNLHKLKLERVKGVEVVFEIESESPTSRELVTTHHNQQHPIILPNLQELDLSFMDNMSHVWKCSNWNKFFTLPKQQSESPFHNLTTIHMFSCRSIKYLFSPLMAELLSNLKDIWISGCNGIKEVVSKRDDEDEEMTTFTSTHTTTILFPHLDSLTLRLLENLKCIGGGGAKDEGSNEISFNNTTATTAVLDQFELSEAGGVSWSLCQYAREIEISKCNVLSSVIPCYAAGQMQKLQVLRVTGCDGMKEVFETQLGTSSNKNRKGGGDEGNGGIPRVNNNVIMLPNLKTLKIYMCGGLEHIFTFSALESLTQLQELKIVGCYGMKVIVKKEEDEYGEQQTTTTTTTKGASSSSSSSSSKKVVVFPRLKSIELFNLPELVGFFLGMNEFRLPSLEEVTIKYCSKMMVFAAGGSTAPQLKYIHTRLGKHTLDQESGLNFHQTSFQSLYGDTSGPATSEGTTWSFHNLIELDMELNYDVKKIIPSSELLQLQKLEKIHVSSCYWVEEVFETALEAAGRNGNSGIGFDESSQTTTTTTLFNLRNLREMKLHFLRGLRYIWKSNQWTAFEFPNLTRVHISRCRRLEHVFTSSMVGSLLQLQELDISWCNHMEEVIVKDADVSVEEDKERESDGKTNKEILVLPRLKSLKLKCLPCLKGFSLGKEDFSFPLLDTLEIYKCPAITTFTKGNSATPQLKEIETRFGSFYAGEDINSSIIKRSNNRSSNKTLINVK